MVGGPYPTASYADILKDRNINIAVIAEGEITLEDILRRMLRNKNRFPKNNELSEIPGIAYFSKSAKNRKVDVTAAIPVTKDFEKISKKKILT